MTTDIYANVLMADGNQVDTDFLNNGPRFQRAMLMDQIIRQRAGAFGNSSTRPEFGGDETELSTLWAYCISPGRAFLRQGSANNKIQLAPGTLMQKIANSDGQDATLIPFTFAGTEEFTLTNGDATNPRVDLLEMKLEYITDTLVSVDFQDEITRAFSTVPNIPTRRRVQCTLQVKAGTPAASPQIPDPDAGFVPVGTVVVGNGWTTAGNPPIFGLDTAALNNAVVHDQRMPLSVHSHRIDPTTFKPELAWALQSVNQIVVASNATNKLYLNSASGPGRIIGVGFELGAGSFTVAPILGTSINAFASNPSAAFLSLNTLFGGGVRISTLLRFLRRDFEGHHAPSVGPIIQESAVNKIGVPVWSSGYRVPQETSAINSFAYAGVGLVNQPNTTALGSVLFYTAS